MATRSVKVSMERRRANGDMNDNNPSALPGHELTGLDGVPRPPAGEAVMHYSRFTQIDSYPDHPAEPALETSEPPDMDMQFAERPRSFSTGKKSVTLACIGSCLFHFAVVAALLMTMVATPEEADDQAGDTLSVVMLGNADVDAKAAGEESKQPEPEQVTAEAVQPQTVQPTKVTPEEPQTPQPDVVQSQTAETQPVETAEAVQPVEQTSPETVISEQPQILATPAAADTTVIQPANAEPVEVQPTEITQAAEPPAEIVMPPIEKPVQRPRPVEKPKDVKKQPQKVANVKSGLNGEDRENLTRGSSEGTETAQSDKNSQSNARRTGAGTAAVESYNGKIRSCVQRAIRGISPSEKNLTVVMRFRIDASGQLLSPGIAGSSSNSEVDQGVLAALRKVGSCSPIPSEIGASSLPFTIAVKVR